MNIVSKNPKLFTKRLLKLERSGRYEEAISQLKVIWEDITKPPKTEGLSKKNEAEIFLRCGSLIGFLGHNKQISDSQELSKNLLTHARNLFLNLYDVEKIVECNNYLALAYWRTGELVEAETWIDEALSHSLPDSNIIKIYSLIIESKIDFANKKYRKICDKFERLEDTFLAYADDGLKGDFFNHFGLALKNLGNKSQVLEKLTLAKKYHEKSGHKVYLGTIENNLAQLYRENEAFEKSHEAVDNALKIYDEIKDRTRKGSSLDTKACIFFDEGKYNQALTTIDESIRILRNSENAAYLVESFQTKAKILVFMDEIASASLCLSEAINIAKNQISEDAANHLAKEFEIAIRKKSLYSNSKNIIEDKPKRKSVELVLHPSLSTYENYRAVRIKNNHLAKIGLTKGSIAFVVKEEVKSGDLIALTEIETDSTICGYYDSYFGMVSLEGIKPEPILYQVEEVRILGKIVGISSSNNTSDGKVQINPINL